jgi:hypothetical protein
LFKGEQVGFDVGWEWYILLALETEDERGHGHAPEEAKKQMRASENPTPVKIKETRGANGYTTWQGHERT